jgi:hypothetical protein
MLLDFGDVLQTILKSTARILGEERGTVISFTDWVQMQGLPASPIINSAFHRMKFSETPQPPDCVYNSLKVRGLLDLLGDWTIGGACSGIRACHSPWLTPVPEAA